MFFSREAGGGAGPVVEAPSEGVPAAEPLAAAGAVEVEVEAGAASLFAVPPSVKRGADEVGAAVVAEDVSAVDLFKLSKKPVVDLDVSGAAEVEVVVVWPLAREPNKFEAGADVVGVEELPPKRDEPDGALVAAVVPD